MIRKLFQAISWRLNLWYWNLFRVQWVLKNFLDFSPKEKVERMTIVVVGRNDNYGGDFSLRLKTTMDWNLKHFPNAELIYVEWNLIPERASDSEWISKRYPNSKCYIVSNQIHKSIAKFPDKMPVMEYFAKNIGLRHASNDWVMLINADCCVGLDAVQQMKHLSKSKVYGTHYESIKWNGEPMSEEMMKDKSLVCKSFPADPKMRSVVGNLILTHRYNWIKATGYDERLTGARAGVDTNGLFQLLSFGLKPMAIGHHYHLDHPESIVNSSNTTHGDDSFIRNMQNVPYRNPENWGLSDYPLKLKSDRIWELEKI